jgi:glycosyltransferase involved in cell wall biosynthesis
MWILRCTSLTQWCESQVIEVQKPRICVPIEVKPEGGMYTFLGNLMRWLDTEEWPHTTDLQSAFDILFVNSWIVPPSTVARVKRSKPGVRVAHRIDGAATDYGSNPASDGVQARVNLLADVTIFQSEYSRYSTREKFQIVAHDGPVIYNPVDVAQFAPGGSRRELPAGSPLVACASWSVNPRKGTWQIDELAARHQNVVFVLCGRFDAVGERPNVVRTGHLTREGMAQTLRSCDVFLNLSENDPCPNVVLEALASGLPVLYRDSGGVPELVGDCGLPVTIETFNETLTRALGERACLSRKARERALARFSPDVIFPRYMQALLSAERAPLPSRLRVLRFASAGYPVLPRIRIARALVSSLERRAPAILRRLAGRGEKSDAHRVGWVTYDSFPRCKRQFRELDSFTGMRVGNVARWMNAHQHDIVNELYDPDRFYAVVVFQKMMDARCQAEADKIRASGGKVVFDANVNYYEIWGDYFVPGTRPTEQQRADALRMTASADWVVADSSYLAGVIRPLNPRVTLISDNVDTAVYRGARQHRSGGPVRLVWSGIGKKAVHLLSIREALASVGNAELVLVVDDPPECLPDLERVIPCRVLRFSHRRYSRTLSGCDIMLSPKRLVNGYEMAHTEYKITLGMAVGLPAIASPQQSYREAIGYRGGGIIADTPGEWRDGIERLVGSPDLRAELGARARQTVAEHYSTPIVAARYLALLRDLVGISVPEPTVTIQ